MPIRNDDWPTVLEECDNLKWTRIPVNVMFYVLNESKIVPLIFCTDNCSSKYIGNM